MGDAIKLICTINNVQLTMYNGCGLAPVGTRPPRPNPFPGRCLEHADLGSAAPAVSFRTRACGRRRQSRGNEGSGYMNKARPTVPEKSANAARAIYMCAIRLGINCLVKA